MRILKNSLLLVETVEKLRELGYKVETDCTKNEPHWSISWQLKI